MRPDRREAGAANLVSWASSLLKRAAQSKALPDGRRIHDRLIRHGHVGDTHLGNCLIEMYGNCGSAHDARSAFDNICNPNLCSWNMLIKAYGHNGCLGYAHCMFGHMPDRDVVSWTAMISVFAQHGHGIEALQLYHQMHVEGIQPNKITFIGALNACASTKALVEGLGLHVAVLEVGYAEDVVVGTALVKMYGNCGKLQIAWSVFSKMPCRDAIAWNAMIAVFVQNGEFNNAMQAFKMAPERNTASWNTMIGACMQSGHGDVALEVFHQMDLEGSKPSVITFVCALNACASLASLEDGKMIHVLIIESGFKHGVEIENALISMYGKCKCMWDARTVFGKMRCLDVVSWTAIIVACTENGHVKDALDFFHGMQLEGVQPDEIAFICSLDACAVLAALEEGQKMDDAIVKLGLEERWMVKTALIDMYGKCGSLQEARHTFDQSPGSNVATWNSLMTALSHNGLMEEVVHLLHEMQQHSIKPNPVTFSCVLNACSHSGWVDNICQVFLSIDKDHDVAYTEDHYLCMVDLLARAGQLEEAEDMIKNFPFENDEGLAWQCLLGACKVHSDIERAVRVANHCFDIDPENASPYALLCNIHYCS